MDLQLQLYEGVYPAEESLLKQCPGWNGKAIDFTNSFLIIALCQQEIIGSALVRCFFWNFSAVIIHLEVLANWRRKGVGTALFKKVKAVMSEKNLHLGSVDFELTVGDDSVKKFLLAQGVSSLEFILRRCYLDSRDFPAQWLNYPFTLSKELKLFYWKYLTEREKLSIEDKIKNLAISEALSPFFSAEKIAYFNSFGLRSTDSEVVGWLITQYLSSEKDIISYTSFYVAPSYRLHGVALYLLSKAIKAQIASPIYKACFDVNINSVDSNWLIFLNRRLIPYCTQIKERFRAHFIQNS